MRDGVPQRSERRSVAGYGRADPARIHPPPRSLAPVVAPRWRGFPTTLPPLIGREREGAAIATLFQQPGRRLLTLIGPGGVGKTRLAVAVVTEIAPSFANGAVFVPLASIRDPALVLPAIARALDIRSTGCHWLSNWRRPGCGC
jgi:hypothetical protein